MPPRIVPFLLEQARKKHVAHLLDDLLVAHGKPKEVEARLRRELRPKKRVSFNDGLAQLAEKLGDHKAAKRMRIKNSVVEFLQREKAAEA